MPEKRKILALVNPYSGTGQALNRWEEAKSLFDLCHIEVELRKTERA